MIIGFTMTLSATEDGYAWVLVNTYEYPIPESFTEDGYYANLAGNSIELKMAWPYGLGAYSSKDYNNPTNLHAKYTWSNPPSVIQTYETLNIKIEKSHSTNNILYIKH